MLLAIMSLHPAELAQLGFGEKWLNYPTEFTYYSGDPSFVPQHLEHSANTVLKFLVFRSAFHAPILLLDYNGLHMAE